MKAVTKAHIADQLELNHSWFHRMLSSGDWSKEAAKSASKKSGIDVSIFIWGNKKAIYEALAERYGHFVYNYDD